MTATQASPLVPGLEHNGICMSPADFDAITEYDDLYKYELIHGVVIVNPIQAGTSLRRRRSLEPAPVTETPIKTLLRSCVHAKP
jgi:hypothetical protein